MKYFIKTLSLALCLFVCSAGIAQQAEFDIKPGTPVILRQGDHFEFIVEVINNSDSEITGQVQLLLADAITRESVDGWFQNVFPNQFFTVAAKAAEFYKFPVEIPFQFTSTLQWTVVAVTRQSKQEKTALTPVLSNQFFTRETARFPLKSLTTDVFIKTLAGSEKVPNLLHRGLSLEVMSTRLWEACKQIASMAEVQNKPLDYFEKWAALSYAKFIIDSFPAVRNLLQSNPSHSFGDPKQQGIVAEVSPWVLSSARPVHAYAQLFDKTANANALSNSFAFFMLAQNDEGSFPWYLGGSGDESATKYIYRTLNKLLTGGYVPAEQVEIVNSIKTKAFKWLNMHRRNEWYTNPQHDSLIAMLKTGSKLSQPLPPIRWKAGNMQLNLNDTTRLGYAFQTINGTLVDPVMNKTVITTRDTARSLRAIVTHDYFTDRPAGKTNQHLKLTKKIYIKRINNTPLPSDENTIFHVGDKLRVVLTVVAMHPIRHLVINDANPSAFYQKGSGMYVQRKTMNFYERQMPSGRKYFFPLLPAGKHEFSYETTVTQAGSFSAGMTSAESIDKPGIFNFIKGFPVTIE
jgi:hypothetical protein